MAPEETQILRLEVGHLQTNCYLVWDPATKSAVIIDPGADASKIISGVEKQGMKPAAILLTHAHFDHTGAVTEIKKKYHIPIYLHESDNRVLLASLNNDMRKILGLVDPPPADHSMNDGETLSFGGLQLQVIHTPGHTPGSVVLKLGLRLFTGDTLFQGGIGRTDLLGGSFKELQQSLERIMELPPDTVIFPGHGDESTLSEEAETNPFL